MQASDSGKTQLDSVNVELIKVLQPGQWLCLENVPSPFSHQKALLLCAISKRVWVTWIPDYGEYLLTL
ncbi:MAG: hypothetical protein ACOC04_06460 [Halothece sp.]